jgi:plastocyanin
MLPPAITGDQTRRPPGRQQLIRIPPGGVDRDVRRSSPILLTAALVAALATSAGAASTRTVVLKDIDFSPSVVTIARGGSVRWSWKDPEVSHNVTSRGRTRFRSSDTRLKGTYTVRFSRKGTYRYVCTIHPNMVGRVVVR